MATALSPKEKIKIPRQHPIERKAEIRRQNFEEVSLGFPEELALIEAQRCLQCKKPVCIDACPVRVDIPAFIRLILEEDYVSAAKKMRETNFLPMICGRVCPQENQCEKVCLVGKKFQPIAIGKLERFIGDFEYQNNLFEIPKPESNRSEKVAIVGSGPAGLTCAAELARMGYQVTIFEALHLPGGVLIYGIPEFRLPKEIVQVEADRLKAMGVEIRTNVVIGRTLTVDDLFNSEGFSAVFLATGAGMPNFLGIAGENLSGVYSASEFLTRINLMKGYRFPEYDTPIKAGKRIAVVGGGDTAMDAVRTAVRLGPDKAYLLYRRSELEMPARKEEAQHAKEEGVEFHVLTNPTKILGNEDGWVKAVECQKMQLGEPDEQGRRRPLPIAGSEYTIDVDTVIIAIGQRPNPILQATTPNLEVARGGVVKVDDEGRTTREGVFAGGDLSRGGATVILAMADGQKAAKAIHQYIQERVLAEADGGIDRTESRT